MKRMILVMMLIAASVMADGDGLYWTATGTTGHITFFRSGISTPGAVENLMRPQHYLKMVDGAVVYMSQSERDAVDAAEAAAAQAAADAAALAASNAATAAAIAWTNEMTNSWSQPYHTDAAHTFKVLGAKYLPGWPTNTTWTYNTAMAAFMAMPTNMQTTVQLWDNVFWQRSYVALSDFLPIYLPSTNAADPTDYDLKRFPWLWDWPGVK